MQATNSRLKIDSYKIWLLILTVSCAVSVLLICWFNRNTVLGCHDSLIEFTYAKQWELSFAYQHAREFCLQRGRAGYLFPLIVTFRFFVHKYGNYWAVWLLQQVPIWFNVFFISFIVGRKTKPFYGIFFAGFFAAFVQIDIDHNLMTCYPLDFMYGLALMITGLYLFDGWLEHRNEGRKSNWIRLIFSCLCYYESMQVYEAFIMACFCYAWISMAYVFKNRREYGRKCFLKFILQLVPHGITGSVFVGILLWLRTHPVVDGTLSSGDPGALGFFPKTWLTFSTALIPLSHRPEISRMDSIRALLTDPFELGCAISAAVAIAALLICIVKEFPKQTREKQQSINLTLVALGLTGAAHALFFPVPLGIDSKYQFWVCTLGARGYLPGIICYFGWALLIVCTISIIANYLSTKNKLLYIPVYAAAVIAVFLGAAFTVSINELYDRAEAPTGICVSKKGQAFFAFVTSDDIEKANADYIYVGPDYNGLGGILQHNNDYANYELGRPVVLTNNAEDFELNSVNYPISSEFRYNGDLVAGYYVVLDNPWDNEEEWVTTGDIIIVTTRPEPVTVTYYDETVSETITIDLAGGRMQSFVITNSDTVNASSITISAGE